MYQELERGEREARVKETRNVEKVRSEKDERRVKGVRERIPLLPLYLHHVSPHVILFQCTRSCLLFLLIFS